MKWLDGTIRREFAAMRHKPWTTGYASLDTHALASGPLKIDGALPADLRGMLYRNGPSRHERGAGRYAHKWDGDGMVHAFEFGPQGISHIGCYVRTRKYLEETAARRFLRSAFGSAVPGESLLDGDADDMNAANISVAWHAQRLLALWEPGSAHVLDAGSLDTLGLLTDEGRALRPFSAHPKIDPLTGALWNFGADPIAGRLCIFMFSADGVLRLSHRMAIEALPPVHDFAITARHLVFLLPPLALSRRRLGAGRPFAVATGWAPSLGTRVLVVDKASWACTWHTLPAMAGFHIGNAWESANGAIRLDFTAADDPRDVLGGWTVMRGDYAHARGPTLRVLELTPGREPRVIAPASAPEAEFPVVDACHVGLQHTRVLANVRQPARPSGTPGWGDIGLFDPQGADLLQSHGYGDDWLAEEHVFAPAAARLTEPARWIVGTALDTAAGQTVVSVFEADNLRNGPVAQARLPYALPLGLHGVFRPLP